MAGEHGGLEGRHEVGQKHVRCWIFAFAFAPFGITSGFITTTMPFLLRDAGLDIEYIATFSAVAVGLSVFSFLWTPIVDLGQGRKSWLFMTTIANAVSLWAALHLRLPLHLAAFAALVLFAGWCASMTHAAAGGLMSIVAQQHSRGRVGAWAEAGNLGGGALGAGLALWCAQRFSSSVAGDFIAAVSVLCGLAALAIHEPQRSHTSFNAAQNRIRRDMTGMFRSARSRLAMIFLVAPVGSAGALNLLPALGRDYHTSSSITILITGITASLFVTTGCLVGGALSDAINRWCAYLAAGLALACVAIAFTAAPLTMPSFVIGASAYLFVTGLCYGALSGFVLEIIGSNKAAASGQYSVLTSLANVAAAGTIWLDGQAYKLWGPRAVFAADGVISAFAAIVLGSVFIRRSGYLCGRANL